MPFEELEILFEDLGAEPTAEQLQEMLDCFTEDFVTNPFQVKGCNVKVILQPSFQREFRDLPETFVHLISRENKYKGKRKPAARELGISERTLYRKINEYNIEE